MEKKAIYICLEGLDKMGEQPKVNYFMIFKK